MKQRNRNIGKEGCADFVLISAKWDPSYSPHPPPAGWAGGSSACPQYGTKSEAGRLRFGCKSSRIISYLFNLNRIGLTQEYREKLVLSDWDLCLWSSYRIALIVIADEAYCWPPLVSEPTAKPLFEVRLRESTAKPLFGSRLTQSDRFVRRRSSARITSGRRGYV